MELKRIKNWMRKAQHKRYVDRYLQDLRWEIVNSAIAFSKGGFTPQAVQHLQNCGDLIRKYERRRRWLKF